MNVPTKRQAQILRNAVAMVKLYPETYSTKYWLAKNEPDEGRNSFPEISPATFNYPAPYTGIAASFAGHVAILLGCNIEGEFTKKTIPKDLRRFFLKAKPGDTKAGKDPQYIYLHLPDLVARYLGGQGKEDYFPLFFEDEWIEPFRSAFESAPVEQRHKILQKRVNHFIKTGC